MQESEREVREENFLEREKICRGNENEFSLLRYENMMNRVKSSNFENH